MWRDEFVAWVKTLASAAVYATLIVTFGFQVARVEGQSMAPTLADQDRLIVNKLAYRIADPQRGDIVMLYYPLNPDKSFVKRVIAEEGDTVRIVDGRVYVNDVPLRDDYVPPEYRSHDDWGPQVIPEGYYFVMGDHRNNSSDSRHWGFVPKKYIIGKVQLRWWPVPNGTGVLKATSSQFQVQVHQARRHAPSAAIVTGRPGHSRSGLNLALVLVTCLDRYAAVSRVLVRVLVLNLLVALAKIALGAATGAVSVLSDGLHSLTDGASNVVALVGVRIARQPPDADHPYGHRKFETMASVAHSPVPAAGARAGAVAAIERLRSRDPRDVDALSFVVMAATLVVNVGVVVYERRAGRRLVERGAAGRRASHAKRPVHVGDGDRRARRRAARVAVARSDLPRIVVAGFIGYACWEIFQDTTAHPRRRDRHRRR